MSSNNVPQDPAAKSRLTLSVAIITFNEEANLARTLASIAWAEEILIVDSGSTDRTAEIAATYQAKFITEEWKGFGAQKNSALRQCTSDWILSLDADEEVSTDLAAEIRQLLSANPINPVCFYTSPQSIPGTQAAPWRLLTRP